MKFTSTQIASYEEQLPFIDAMFSSFSDIGEFIRWFKLPVAFSECDGDESIFNQSRLDGVLSMPINVVLFTNDCSDNIRVIVQIDEETWSSVSSLLYDHASKRNIVFELIVGMYLTCVQGPWRHKLNLLFDSFVWFAHKFDKTMNPKTQYTMRTLLQRDGQNLFFYYFAPTRKVTFDDMSFKSSVKRCNVPEVPLFTQADLDAIASLSSKVEKVAAESCKKAKLDEEANSI